MHELQDINRRIGETNALIDRQRQQIEISESDGGDITSAQIIFDSLYRSLSLQVQERQRIREILDSKNNTPKPPREPATPPMTSVAA